MKLPNLSQPVLRANLAEAPQTGVMPSVSVGCVIKNCGFGAVKCIAAYASGGIPAAIRCLGNVGPGCISCFTG